MRARKIYLDTSVIGGYFDTEFMAPTRQLWTLAEAGKYEMVTSEVTQGEMAEAPEAVRALFQYTFTELLAITEDAHALARAYIKHGVVTEKYFDDSLHVAVATVERINPVVSWNFKHLVNLHREEAFCAVNLINAFPQLRIVNPDQLVL